jgi:hypothetical protein
MSSTRAPPTAPPTIAPVPLDDGVLLGEANDTGGSIVVAGRLVDVVNTDSPPVVCKPVVDDSVTRAPHNTRR